MIEIMYSLSCDSMVSPPCCSTQVFRQASQCQAIVLGFCPGNVGIKGPIIQGQDLYRTVGDQLDVQ